MPLFPLAAVDVAASGRQPVELSVGDAPGKSKPEIESAPRPGGKIHYARSLPTAKACDDVLLALQLLRMSLLACSWFFAALNRARLVRRKVLQPRRSFEMERQRSFPRLVLSMTPAETSQFTTW